MPAPALVLGILALSECFITGRADRNVPTVDPEATFSPGHQCHCPGAGPDQGETQTVHREALVPGV